MQNHRIGGAGMGRILSRSRFTIGSRLAMFGFWTSSAFAAETTGPDSVHLSMALSILMILAMLAFEVGLFWKAWKNRLPEEEPEAMIQPPQPVIPAQVPVPTPHQRKRASKRREKALV